MYCYIYTPLYLSIPLYLYSAMCIGIYWQARHAWARILAARAAAATAIAAAVRRCAAARRLRTQVSQAVFLLYYS